MAPSGNDANPGTVSQPFLTLPRARDAVRAINHGMTGDVVVNLRAGLYPVTAPVEFTPADSGCNGFKVIYRACKNEQPVISGGVPVGNWKLDHDHIYKATLDSNDKLRCLYVNGSRALLTRKEVKGRGPWGTFVVKGTEPWAETSGTTLDGICFDPSEVPALANPSDVELTQHRTFTFPLICARDEAEDGTFRIIKLQQPYGAIAATMAWGCKIDPRQNFTLCNAFEFLSQPGQFYFNRVTHTLYYFARAGEDMSRVAVIAPLSSGLLRVTGRSVNDRVHDVAFSGITFCYDHWLLQSVGDSHGVVGVQSLGLYTRFRADGNHHRDHYDMLDLPQATVELRNCRDIEFTRNRFEHLASGCAVNLINDVTDSAVVGNTFGDISGNAVNVGHPQHYIIGDGPLYPAGVEGVCARDRIFDNWIRNVCLEFKQEEAISGFFTEAVEIAHNDIAGVPYGGIALGWWWGDSAIPPSTTSKNNVIACNKVVDTQKQLPGDGGAIYVLGHQPGGRIEGNYVRSLTRLIYTDDGSAYWTITRNVLEPSPRGGTWLNIWVGRCHDLKIDGNYATTKLVNNKGTNTPVLNSRLETHPWSPEAQAIIDAAGLEPAYKDIAGVLSSDQSAAAHDSVRNR